MKTSQFSQNSLNETENEDLLQQVTSTKLQTREVILRGETCQSVQGCGCGGTTTECVEVTVVRVVPFDSEYQDYDYIGSAIEDSDQILY